ncbi:unnamed protein product [Amoebophrya sp. A120]|nr:unnamed protein product [Amoebophrya sp. A120]|eukprot:GSA120T00022211001.1
MRSTVSTLVAASAACVSVRADDASMADIRGAELEFGDEVELEDKTSNKREGKQGPELADRTRGEKLDEEQEYSFTQKEITGTVTAVGRDAAFSADLPAASSTVGMVVEKIITDKELTSGNDLAAIRRSLDHEELLRAGADANFDGVVDREEKNTFCSKIANTSGSS